MRRSICLIVLLLLSLTGCRQERQENTAPVTMPEDNAASVKLPDDTAASVKTAEDKTASIATAEKLGRMIHERDLCAAIAANIMLAEIPHPEEKGIVGRVTVISEDHAEVTLIQSQQDQLTAFGQVVFEKNKRPQFIQNARPLTEQELAMFRAQRHAPEIIKRYCTDTYNTVVLPAPDGQGWLVYTLAATTDPTVIVAGGHYRATISPDGKTILSQRNLTAACEEIPFPNLPAGARPVAYTVTHPLDDTPTEIHVFLSLLHKMPCYVTTKDGRNWYVENGTITLK